MNDFKECIIYLIYLYLLLLISIYLSTIGSYDIMYTFIKKIYKNQLSFKSFYKLIIDKNCQMVLKTKI